MAGPASTTPDRCPETTSSCLPGTWTGTRPSAASSSRGHLAGEKQFPIFERSVVTAALDEARGHLIGLSGCRNGQVPRHLLGGDRSAALQAARTWARHFADGDFHVELSHHLEPDDDWLVAQLAELAADAGLPVVVTNEVHYAEPDGHRLQDVLVCIRHGATLEEARELLLPNADYRLKSGAELAVIGAGLPDERSRRTWGDGMARSAVIGERCRLELGFERYRFPGFTVPAGETAFSYLYQLAHDGLRQRYRPITKRALSQLTHELDVIDRTNLAEFFLIVWDLMEFARAGGIIGQGRGSAGDSIVAYCLGITKVDPIEHKLLFERFINEARALPDIDIDFDVNRREEVIQYLYTRYGADHAAMVCTIITYRARSAVREVAKALGFPAEGIDALAKALDTRDATDVARDLALDGSFAWLFDELGVDMADAAVPPGRDGRGSGLVHPTSDSSWNSRPRPTLDPRRDQRGRLVPAEEGTRARHLGHERPARVGDDEALRALRRAGRHRAATADAARQRLARTSERAPGPRAGGSGERHAGGGATPAAGRAQGSCGSCPGAELSATFR